MSENMVPRGGEGLGISCKYPVEVYGDGIGSGQDYIQWTEMTANGFPRPEGMVAVDQYGEHHPMDEMMIACLRDDDGNVVATWDEGRWWTQEESAAFVLTLTNPLMRQMAEATALNRSQRRRRK